MTKHRERNRHTSEFLNPEGNGEIAEAGNTSKPSQVQIKQRDFESAAFTPGFFMIDSLMKKEEYKNDPIFKNLRTALGYMCSTDELGENDSFGKKNEQGNDFRDELRKIALEICAGKYKDGQEVQEVLDSSAKAFGIPADSKKLDSIKNAFKVITPEFMEYILDDCSVFDENKKTLTVGAKLPFEIVSRISSDAQRIDYMSGWYAKHLMEEGKTDQSDVLGMLITEVYRDKDNNFNQEAINNEGFDKLHDKYGNVVFQDLDELIKAQEQEGMDM
jgi:hypothetical protein